MATSQEIVTAKDLETFGSQLFEQIYDFASHPYYPDYYGGGDRHATTTWHIQDPACQLEITASGEGFELPSSPWTVNQLALGVLKKGATSWSNATLLGADTANAKSMRLDEDCDSTGLLEILGLPDIAGMLGYIDDHLPAAMTTRRQSCTITRPGTGAFAIIEKTGVKMFDNEALPYAERSLQLRHLNNLWFQANYKKIFAHEKWSLFSVVLTDLSPGEQPPPPFPFYRERLESLQAFGSQILQAAVDFRDGEITGRKDDPLPDGSDPHFVDGYRRGRQLSSAQGAGLTTQTNEIDLPLLSLKGTPIRIKSADVKDGLL